MWLSFGTLQLSIQTRDRYNNDLPDGGLEWTVRMNPIEGGSVIIGSVDVSPTGLYPAHYIPEGFVGYAVLEVTLDAFKVPTQSFIWEDQNGVLHPRATDLIGGSGYPDNVILCEPPPPCPHPCLSANLSKPDLSLSWSPFTRAVFR